MMMLLLRSSLLVAGLATFTSGLVVPRGAAAAASCRGVLRQQGRPSGCLYAKKPSMASDDFLRAAQFDLLSLSSWRRETLIRYSNANQSEPLRILLFGFMALTLAGCTFIAEAVGGEGPQGLDLAGYYAGAAISAGLFARERGNRSKQLARLEREMQVADLELTLTVNAAVPGSQKRLSVRALRGERRLIVALCKDKKTFVQTRVLPLQRRLDSARVVVVALSSLEDVTNDSRYECVDAARWRAAFAELSGSSDEEAWFALSFRGRSVGSGLSLPDLNLLLGSLFPPVDILDATPPLAEAANDVSLSSDQRALLRQQAAFYGALTSGDLEAMESLFFLPSESDEVTKALADGARLDPWDSQLADGSRPSDLKVGDADATIIENLGVTTGVTTAVEETERGATLLATQRWRRDDSGEWKLVAHETIPFASGTSARALLRCDARGCVALVK